MVNCTRCDRLRSCLILLALAGLLGCASQSVLLVHPQSGATVRCNAAGAGLMAGVAGNFVAQCMSKYEKEGYLSVDKLTSEQRADLEKRGVVPKPEPPTFPMDRM